MKPCARSTFRFILKKHLEICISKHLEIFWIWKPIRVSFLLALSAFCYGLEEENRWMHCIMLNSWGGKPWLCRSKLRFPSLPPTQEGERSPLWHIRRQNVPYFQLTQSIETGQIHEKIPSPARPPSYWVWYIVLGPGSINRWNLWWRKDLELTSYKFDWCIF